jgi:hypothetical protein
MAEPTPEQPSDAGVPEIEPTELGQQESANLLANEARDRLRADGFTDAQIGRWAETFIAERSAGDAAEFIAWIIAQEQQA